MPEKPAQPENLGRYPTVDDALEVATLMLRDCQGPVYVGRWSNGWCYVTNAEPLDCKLAKVERK